MLREAPGESAHVVKPNSDAMPLPEETGGRYSISEWWLKPHTKGPGIHSHKEDDVFYVLDGVMSIYAGGRWVHAKKGALVIAPGGVPHDFENRSDRPAGILNFKTPGNYFEEEMPPIAQWFRERPLKYSLA